MSRLVRTLLVIALACGAGAVVEDVIEVIRLGTDITGQVLDSWDAIGQLSNATGGVQFPYFKPKDQVVLTRLRHISGQIRKVEHAIDKVGAMTFYLGKNLGRGTDLELRLHEMTDLLNRVSSADRKMREYMGLQQELEKVTLLDFAEWCVSHDQGALPGLLERIHSLIVPPHKHLLGQSLLTLLQKRFQDEASETCTAAMSPHQLIFDIYNTVALTEIKGYAMMQFSWMLLRIYGKGNFTQEASLTRQRYSQRTAQAAAVAKSALSEASRDLYMCDPPMHIEGSTYEQVTRLLQGYVENEVDMNTDGTCKENCAHYTLAEKHGCYMDQFCAKQTPCRGRIIDCQYLDSDMWVCPASRNSNRRYEWIEYENGRKLGNVGSCSRGTTKVDSWWRWNLLHCSYCFCLCEDDVNSSERFFSMKEATADISNNKVVTGLRLVKIGRVFHLQVHEGTLKERGSVEPSGWVPVNKFDPNDPGMMDGIDYHTLTYEKRAIDLDELDSPEGHVLTGVRFRVIGAHLHFEIRSTPFNYTTGRLSPSKSQWVSNDNTEGSDTPRSKLELKTPDLPTRSHTRMEVDSNHDQYVEFTHSDFDADAAQSTVPFIDVQPVLPSKGAALATGAGVIHRGAPSSGGFIALKLRSYNNARHVKAEPPPADFTEEKDDAADFVLPVVNN
ncbi:hypothetical protein O3G_MSEX005930 [Manduca sexta]|uniref:Uncharacterized protein n=1 Tax=Manduca sexta TaxID=7130 RepID=A0A921Z0M7_MANSE|nr:hypothetical protein O3G_MSEX005930 [Manduca sexta]